MKNFDCHRASRLNDESLSLFPFNSKVYHSLHDEFSWHQFEKKEGQSRMLRYKSKDSEM